MRSGGALLVVLGVLVLAQVLAGDVLGRLGIAGGGSLSMPPDSSLVPKSTVPHDAQGQPL